MIEFGKAPSVPMRRISRELLEEYCAGDRIARLIAAEARPGDEYLTSQRWLVETPARRLVYELLYHDLLETSGQRILDVGGGLSAVTRRLASRHSYELIDLMVHDAPERVAAFERSVGFARFEMRDWWECDIAGSYDVVIANDLFPNADQRLALFLQQMLPVAREVRLSVTYYNYPRFYMARRLDGDEVLCLLAWDGQQTAAVLKKFADRIKRPEWAQFERTDGSLYPNGRQVSVLSLRGDLAG